VGSVQIAGIESPEKVDSFAVIGGTGLWAGMTGECKETFDEVSNTYKVVCNQH